METVSTSILSSFLGSSEGLPGGLLDPTGTRQGPRTSELFTDELERSIEREGGERRTDERSDAHVLARRSDRRAGFEEHRAQSFDRRAAAHPEDSEAAPLAPATTPAADDRSLRDQPRAPGAESARNPVEDPSRTPASGGSRPAEPPTPPAFEINSVQLIYGGRAPAASAVAGAAGVNLAAGTGAVRAEHPALAFVQGARDGRLTSAAAAKAPAPPTLAEQNLIEHADEVLRQIRLKLAPGMRRAVIELSPAELGRLSIRLSMQDGGLAARVRAESPATLDLLEQRLPELRAILAEQGIAADRLDLELGFGARPDARAEHGWSGTARGSTAKVAATRADTHEHTPSRALSGIREGGIDTYA